ncbi:MAG: hypothetical protein KGI38_12535 [Thaumarchaeota archaeon]|nr:hypothetical protein [Nitrososphaerota archaeon]
MKGLSNRRKILLASAIAITIVSASAFAQGLFAQFTFTNKVTVASPLSFVSMSWNTNGASPVNCPITGQSASCTFSGLVYTGQTFGLVLQLQNVNTGTTYTPVFHSNATAFGPATYCYQNGGSFGAGLNPCSSTPISVGPGSQPNANANFEQITVTWSPPMPGAFGLRGNVTS